MTLADRPRLSSARNGRAWRVDELRREMPEDDMTVMDAYLTDPALSADRVAAELTAAGYPISTGAIAAYRFRVLGVGKRPR